MTKQQPHPTTAAVRVIKPNSGSTSFLIKSTKRFACATCAAAANEVQMNPMLRFKYWKPKVEVICVQAKVIMTYTDASEFVLSFIQEFN